MSVIGGEADILWPCRRGPLLTRSGHWWSVIAVNTFNAGRHGPALNERAAVLNVLNVYRRLRAFSQNSSPGSFPAAAAYSTQPFGHAGRLNANTVCSGSSFAWAGSAVAAFSIANKNAAAILTKPPN